MKVGIYVHHHGAGHLRRARSIAEVLRNLPRMEKPRSIPELFRLTGLHA